MNQGMRNTVTADEVFDFKERFCDENKIISQILRTELNRFMMSPILDVGAGLGDIAYQAFPDKRAVCIDLNEGEKTYPLASGHARQKIDFFDYMPDEQIGTVLIAHALQFIDDDVDALNDKISQLSPQYLVTVTNANDDFMGEIIQWTKRHFSVSNPETDIVGFPKDYELIKECCFQAKIHCPDFDTLAQQIGYFMMVEIETKKSELDVFLHDRLDNNPAFDFKQNIRVYEKQQPQSSR